MKFVQEATGNPGAYSGIITPARRLESLDRRGGIFDRCEHDSDCEMAALVPICSKIVENLKVSYFIEFLLNQVTSAKQTGENAFINGIWNRIA